MRSRKTTMLYLDTNVILRYLLEDHDIFFEQARKYIEEHRVFIKNEVMAEVVYVLNKTYKVPKVTVKDILKEFLSIDNVTVDSVAVSEMALETFSSDNIDFVDALLCAYQKFFDYRIVSFDKKLNRCIGKQLKTTG